MNDLITIGVINYNRREYIEQCIKSIEEQTYSNTELIIIDDCSTDGSQDFISNYNRDNYSFILHDKNTGNPAKAINEIIEKAKGEYIFLMASDDYLTKDCISELYNHIGDSDFCYSGYFVVDKRGIIHQTVNAIYYSPEDAVKRVLLHGGSGVITTVGLYKAQFLKNAHYILYNGVEFDTLNVMRFIKLGYKYKPYSFRPLMYYRRDGKNRSYDMRYRAEKVNAGLNYIIENFDISKFGVEKEDISKIFYKLIDNYYNGIVPNYPNDDIPKEEMDLIVEPLKISAEKYSKK
jgi:glycosyltransferase involved in cell wall biosynthesis